MDDTEWKALIDKDGCAHQVGLYDQEGGAWQGRLSNLDDFPFRRPTF